MEQGKYIPKRNEKNKNKKIKEGGDLSFREIRGRKTDKEKGRQKLV